jgi:hypothetical protein
VALGVKTRVAAGVVGGVGEHIADGVIVGDGASVGVAVGSELGS